MFPSFALFCESKLAEATRDADEHVEEGQPSPPDPFKSAVVCDIFRRLFCDQQSECPPPTPHGAMTLQTAVCHAEGGGGRAGQFFARYGGISSKIHTELLSSIFTDGDSAPTPPPLHLHPHPSPRTACNELRAARHSVTESVAKWWWHVCFGTVTNEPYFVHSIKCAKENELLKRKLIIFKDQEAMLEAENAKRAFAVKFTTSIWSRKGRNHMFTRWKLLTEHTRATQQLLSTVGRRLQNKMRKDQIRQVRLDGPPSACF